MSLSPAKPRGGQRRFLELDASALAGDQLVEQSQQRAAVGGAQAACHVLELERVAVEVVRLELPAAQARELEATSSHARPRELHVPRVLFGAERLQQYDLAPARRRSPA